MSKGWVGLGRVLSAWNEAIYEFSTNSFFLKTHEEGARIIN